MISVIVPVYNVEKYIVDCLRSLEMQTYKDFEVILINDGSTDNSLEKIYKYLENSNLKSKIINQKNVGVSAARNAGIKLSKGDYLAFVDSDDVVHPKYLETQFYNMVKNEVDISICDVESLNEDITEYNVIVSNNDLYVCDKEEILKKMLFGLIKPGIWRLLSKKGLFKNIQFAEGVAYGEDLEMVWKLISKAEYIAVSSSKLYGYRIRAGSAMGTMSPKRLDGMKLFERLESYFNEFLPEFGNEFKKYGVARWVWATMWQIVIASNTYEEFKENMAPYKPYEKMRKLITYPELKVKVSSLIYLISPFLYYCCVKMIRKKLRNVS